MQFRARSVLTLTALVTASLFINTTSATATTNVVGDASFDNGSGYDGRGDIVTHGAAYHNNTVTVAVSSRIPTNPATDSNWINYLTGVIWNLDTNGDGEEDYYAVLINAGGLSGSVYRSSDSVKMCDVSPSYDASSGIIFAHFQASCIGTAPGFTLQTAFLYGTSSTDSFDVAPDNLGFAAGVTRTVDAPPTTTTTTTQPDSTFNPADGGGGGVGGISDGYWMTTSSGNVFTFGNAGYFGAGGPNTVHIEPSITGQGYWVLAKNGEVHGKGDAAYLGAPQLGTGENAVSLSATPTGQGYWVFTDKGRVIPFGNAVSFGDMSGHKLNGPILGSVATPTGGGYWMVGSDGGIFSFGDAVFHGSTGNIKLNKPVMAMAPAANGSGYWLVASDGGIFAFGVPFYGSMGATPLNKPVSGMVPGTAGYMMVGQDGGIFSFGSVAFHGSLGANPPASPVVGVALKS